MLAERIAGENISMAATDLDARRKRLRSLLITARAARANLAVSLSRVRAASGFTKRHFVSGRQGVGI